MSALAVSRLPRSPRRPAAFVVLGAAALALWSASGRQRPAQDRSEALVEALRARGLEARADDVRWVDGPPGALGSITRRARVVVRAIPGAGEPHDVFLVHARLSPEGVLLDVGSAHNLSETPAADESRPSVLGERVAFLAEPLVEGAAPTVQVIDVGGARVSLEGWKTREKLQLKVQNLQQVGQADGIGRATFVVEAAEGAEKEGEGSESAPRPALAARLEEGALVVVRGSEEARVPLLPGGGVGEPGAGWLRAEPRELARPGNLVTWAVDRVRALPFVGDEGMQTIKAVAFTALDFVLRNKEAMTGDTGAEDIAADLGRGALDPPKRAMVEDPEIGWPPPPLEPWVTPPLPGEGEWNPQDKDPFVRVAPGLPPAFLTTFVRTDRSRKATRVYVALWDPRQIELHMMAGTVEPKSATGEAGPGIIPRDPALMKRVVAASNAGFQALHGEFGMMADGVVYLPPKPYAATVAVTRDGSTAFGSWPADPSIPDDVVGYRQNMTVMVQDGKWNPYGRTWWGGTPPGWEDKTHTVRTGICLTRENFVGYFYGADLSPEALAQGMIQARCKYGLALDMNAGHSGLEFYKVAPADAFEPLDRPLQTSWEAEGEVSGLEGFRFRGRRLVRGMGLMNFPRYIRREARDFFYMTLRPMLPGEPLEPGPAPAHPGEGAWKVKGLPQHGFPYALAQTELRPDASRPDVSVRVLKVDPRAVEAQRDASSKKVVLALDAGDGVVLARGGEPLSLWHVRGAFTIAPSAPGARALRLATGQAGAGAAQAAVGIQDDDGMLVYAELSRGAAEGAGPLLDALLARMGCGSRMVLPQKLPLALGGDTSLAGAAVHPPSGPNAAILVRADTASGKRIFEDTPIVPHSEWGPLQRKRIRYFKKPASEEGAASDP